MDGDPDESDALTAATIVAAEDAVISGKQAKASRGEVKFEDFMKRGNANKRPADEPSAVGGASAPTPSVSGSSAALGAGARVGPPLPPPARAATLGTKGKKRRKKALLKLKKLDNKALLSFGDDDNDA